MTTTSFDDDNYGNRVHSERTVDLSPNEKDIFNDGYLWASADAIEVISGILQEPGLSAQDRVDLFTAVAESMSIPLLIASIATGKQFLK
jgi:hypothetical protein